MESTTSMDLFNSNLHLMDDAQKLELAKDCKNEGVELYMKREFRGAFLKFSLGVKYLVTILSKSEKGEDNPLEAEKSQLITVLYNNLASCHVQKGNWEHAADVATSVLEKDPLNVKALYRRGISYIEIQEYEKARIDLDKLLELEPDNQLAKNRINLLNERVRQFNNDFAVRMKKMFV